ncbi:MAG TPA: hypothetical protein GXZ90_08565 [Clostridiales bacterium]|nr:hypothetical protein [Clostridiales bacterium]
MEYLISLMIAIILLFLGEKLPNETKTAYIQKGYNWEKVLICSNLVAIVGGLMSTGVILFYNISNDFNPIFLPFVTSIVVYITVQSIMTDVRILLINRNILRVAYVSAYLISIYNVMTNDLFKIHMLALITFTIVLVLLFIFSSIGASDIRALAVALPYTISIGGYLAIRMLIITLIVLTVIMAIKRYVLIKNELKVYKVEFADIYNELGEKTFNRVYGRTIKKEFDNSDEHAMPVGPFMIAPFMLFLIIYPIII